MTCLLISGQLKDLKTRTIKSFEAREQVTIIEEIRDMHKRNEETMNAFSYFTVSVIVYLVSTIGYRVFSWFSPIVRQTTQLGELLDGAGVCTSVVLS